MKGHNVRSIWRQWLELDLATSMIYTNRYTDHLQREQLALRTESSLLSSRYLMLSFD